MKFGLPKLRHFQFSIFNFQKEGGVTLIELLMVVGIIGVLAAVGGITFVNSEKKQLLKSATEQVLADLKVAQNRALAGVQDDPGGTAVTAYSVASISSTTYEIVRNLAGGGVSRVILRAVDSQVTLSFTASPQFAITTGKVLTTADVTLGMGSGSNCTSYADCYCIKVSGGGRIGRGELNGGCPL